MVPCRSINGSEVMAKSSKKAVIFGLFQILRGQFKPTNDVNIQRHLRGRNATF
jgi:hypothetical protein